VVSLTRKVKRSNISPAFGWAFLLGRQWERCRRIVERMNRVGGAGQHMVAVHGESYSSSWPCVPALLENYLQITDHERATSTRPII
jgi:hypothetical protein